MSGGRGRNAGVLHHATPAAPLSDADVRPPHVVNLGESQEKDLSESVAVLEVVVLNPL